MKKISCPDCGIEHITFTDVKEISCDCGAQIPMFAFIPKIQKICQTIKLLSEFQNFSKQKSVSGDIYYTVDISNITLQVWQVSTFVPEVHKKIWNHQVRLPIQIIFPNEIKEQYHLLVYQAVLGRPLNVLTPLSLAIALFEFLEYIHTQGCCIPNVISVDLDIITTGKVRLLQGHKLCTRHTHAADVSTIARIWYSSISDAHMILDDILSPRIWYPDMPVGLWGVLRACMHIHAHKRPSVSNILVLLKGIQQQKSIPVDIFLGVYTDVGRKSDQKQEDACGYHKSTAVVSDGVSQSQWGDIASKIVVKTILEEGLLQEQINKANSAIGTYILEHAENARNAQQFVDPMSATVVAASFSSESVTCVSLGDSRAYLLSHQYYLEKLTEDHNGRWEYVIKGENFDQATDVLSLARWVGDFEYAHVRSHDINPLLPKDIAVDCQVIHFLWRAGDKLLLCSDGLHDFLTDDNIETILKQSDDPNVIAQQLVNAAIMAQDLQGIGDNVTALVLCAKERITLPQLAHFYCDLKKHYPFIFCSKDKNRINNGTFDSKH